MAIKLILLSMVSISMGACVTSYAQPKESDDFATITFTKTPQPDADSRGDLQEYGVTNGGGCKQYQRLALMGLLSKNTKSSRLVVGEPITILATYQFQENLGLSMTESTPVANVSLERCRSSVTFTPEAGTDYDMTMTVDGAACAMKFNDAATGGLPERAIIDPNVTCKVD